MSLPNSARPVLFAKRVSSRHVDEREAHHSPAGDALDDGGQLPLDRNAQPGAGPPLADPGCYKLGAIFFPVFMFFLL
jgi:hypothetical protein